MPPFPPAPTTSTPDRELDPWELRDPSSFLHELDELLPLVPGVTVALVHESSAHRRLVRAARLHGRPDPDDPSTHDSQVLHDIAHRLCDGIDPQWPIEYSFVTVVVRDGRCVFSEVELGLLGAWRYANHLMRVFHGELVLVTPSGWATFMGDDAGGSPTARSGAGHR